MGAGDMALSVGHVRYSEEEYLAMEASAAVKHEYLDGEIHAMAGASERHNRIALNAAYHLRTAARGTRCGVYIADMKLRLAAQNVFYYPDVMLVCAEEDDHPLYKTSPCILVEVLSAATAAIDRREKWLAYRGIPTLKAYLLVDADQRRCDYQLREETGAWRAGTLEEDEILTLYCGSLTIPLTLDDLYEDVGFGV
jgi:Uma2 family endonuclease